MKLPRILLTCDTSFESHKESVGRNKGFGEGFTECVHREVVERDPGGQFQVSEHHRGVVSHVGVGHHIIPGFVEAAVSSKSHHVIRHLLTLVLGGNQGIVSLQSRVSCIKKKKVIPISKNRFCSTLYQASVSFWYIKEI